MKRPRRTVRRRARRWTTTEARALLSELELSGQSVSRFAREHGLGVERLYRWRRRIGTHARPKADKPRFAEIAIASPTDIEMVLPGGMAFHFTGSSRVEDALAILTRLPKS